MERGNWAAFGPGELSLISHRHQRVTTIVTLATGLALVAALAPLRADAGAEQATVTIATSDSGIVDNNGDGVGDVANYGASNHALSIGEQPSDGHDLRLVMPFTLSAAARSLVDSGGTAALRYRVWRASNLGTRTVKVSGWAGGLGGAGDYARAATSIRTVAPVEGAQTIDLTTFLRATPGTNFVLRFELSNRGVKDGKQTQVNLAMADASVADRRPRVVVTGASAPAATPTTAVPAIPPTTLTLSASADTYTSEETPTVPHGDYTYLRVGQGSFDRKSFLRFDVGGFTSITSATLRVRSQTASTAPVTIATTTSFDEALLTWNGQPAETAAVATASFPTAGAWTNVDVTGAIPTNGAVNLVLRDGPNGSVSLTSREGGASAQLVVTGLTAAGGTGPVPDPQPGETTTTQAPTTTIALPTTTPPTTTVAPPSTTTPTTAAPTTTTTAPATGWSLVWGDEFDSAAVDTGKWNVRNGWAASNEESYVTNRPENVFVSNGALTIRARREEIGGRHFSSGYLDSGSGKGSWTYGRMEMRAKLPMAQGVGLWPAFWMRPNDGGNGEIDIMEAWSKDGPTKTAQTLHRDYTGGTPHQGHQDVMPGGQVSTDWHVYAMEWEADEMRFYVDDRLVYTRNVTTTSWYREVFSRAYHFRINLQVGGSWGGTPPATTTFPADFVIDYVRVYQR